MAPLINDLTVPICAIMILIGGMSDELTEIQERKAWRPGATD
jgi:hypothetical protein